MVTSLSAEHIASERCCQVSFRAREEEQHYELNGKSVAMIFIRKEAQANTVDTTNIVKKEIDKIKLDPQFGETSFFVYFDQGEMIQSALDGLMQAGKDGVF